MAAAVVVVGFQLKGYRHFRWNIPVDLSPAWKGRAEKAAEQVNGALLCVTLLTAQRPRTHHAISEQNRQEPARNK